MARDRAIVKQGRTAILPIVCLRTNGYAEAHGRPDRLHGPEDPLRRERDRARHALVLLGHAAHRRVPHRPREGRRPPARGPRARRRRPRRRRAYLGRLAVVLSLRRRAARPAALAVPRDFRRRARQARGRDLLAVRGHLGDERLRDRPRLVPGLPQEAGIDGRHPRHERGPRAPRLEPGARIGASLAAYDHRLASLVVTLEAESESNGFVNGHAMLHSRWMPSITPAPATASTSSSR